MNTSQNFAVISNSFFDYRFLEMKYLDQRLHEVFFFKKTNITLYNSYNIEFLPPGV